LNNGRTVAGSSGQRRLQSSALACCFRNPVNSVAATLGWDPFFTVEVLTWRGLMTYYVLFFIHLESRRISLAEITRHPDEAWMQQMARNATDKSWGHLERRRYALHDRDSKFCSSFRVRWFRAESGPFSCRSAVPI
jgi:hypothetical protein